MENYQILLCVLFGVCVAAVVYLIYKVSQSIRNKNQFSVLLLVSLLLCLSACTADDNPVSGSNELDINTYQEPDYASVATDLPVFVSASIDSEVSSALNTKCESITHNYSMSLKNKVLDIKGASADYLSANGSIDVIYTIYAAYEYDHLDKSDNHRIAQYRIDGIDIIKGADEESSTKEISTANGKFVKEYPKEQ